MTEPVNSSSHSDAANDPAPQVSATAWAILAAMGFGALIA